MGQHSKSNKVFVVVVVEYLNRLVPSTWVSRAGQSAKHSLPVFVVDLEKAFLALVQIVELEELGKKLDGYSQVVHLYSGPAWTLQEKPEQAVKAMESVGNVAHAMEGIVRIAIVQMQVVLMGTRIAGVLAVD